MEERKMDRIHELLDELADAIKAKFPDYSQVSAVCDTDGYRTLTVTKWGKGEATEVAPRRELFSQSRLGGKWGEDNSQRQNEYYASLGVLLKD